MHNSKASLYLMELMISILFFAISSTVCIQLFVKAHMFNEETDIRTNAVVTIQNTAEYFLSSSGDKEQTMAFYPDCVEKDNQATIYFDDTFTPCTADKAFYAESITFTSDDSFSYATIKLCDVNETTAYYELNLKKYVPGGSDANEKE